MELQVRIKEAFHIMIIQGQLQSMYVEELILKIPCLKKMLINIPKDFTLFPNKKIFEFFYFFYILKFFTNNKISIKTIEVLQCLD
jgi:hypothetical protein